jgi:hypothetical protein
MCIIRRKVMSNKVEDMRKLLNEWNVGLSGGTLSQQQTINWWEK